MMNDTNSLMTKEAVFKERISTAVFNTDELDKFMMLYVQMLGFACEIGMITEERRDKISTYLLTAMREASDGYAIKVANFLYVSTLYLRSMDNWDAINALIELDSVVSATKFLGRAIVWLKTKLQYQKAVLGEIEKNVPGKKFALPISLFSKQIEAFQNLEINLKQEHINLKTRFWGYEPLKIIEASDYLEMLSEMLKCFKIEMSIFKKMNGSEFLKLAISEYDSFETKSANSYMSISDKYKKLIKEENDRYNKLIVEIADFDAKYDNLSDEEQLKVDPKLLEKYDSVRAEQQHQKKVLRIKTAWSKEETEAENQERKIRACLGTLEMEANSPDLNLLLKEFALVSKAKKDEISYPTTPIDKAMCIEHMSNSEAIAEALLFTKEFGLEQKEIDYLISCS